TLSPGGGPQASNSILSEYLAEYLGLMCGLPLLAARVDKEEVLHVGQTVLVAKIFKHSQGMAKRYLMSFWEPSNTDSSNIPVTSI
ncbi:hypothetical protein, partial [Salmonella sp. s60093]|uniref:hypothetical protein n=1 Tax=Salmonella sp. s60093 TaxID=3159721 RepID=UPI00397F063B